MPAASRIALTFSAGSSWFLGENASIDGAMMEMRSSGRSYHTNALRENTSALAFAT